METILNIHIDNWMIQVLGFLCAYIAGYLSSMAIHWRNSE